MAGTILLNVNFPNGLSRWSNTPEIEFKNNKIGFYEINFIAPTNLTYSILPIRTEEGLIKWTN